MELSLGTSVKNQQIPMVFSSLIITTRLSGEKQQLRKFVNNQQFQRNVLMFLPLANEVVLDRALGRRFGRHDRRRAVRAGLRRLRGLAPAGIAGELAARPGIEIRSLLRNCIKISQTLVL